MKKILKKSKHSKALVTLSAISAFALIAVFGFSILTGNTDQSNVGTSYASTQEPADINSDNTVNVFDLSILLSKWNTADTTSDLNKDGTVNVFDLSILLSKWGVVTVATRPDASNTGVPAGTVLKSLAEAYPNASTKGYYVNSSGRVYISKAGEVYENVTFPAGVVIKAANITIRNSRISGGRSSFSSIIHEPTSWDDCRSIYLAGQASGGGGQIVDANDAAVSNLLIEDSDILVNPSEYSSYINDYMGHDTTMRRVDISGGVDGIGTHNGSGPNVNFTIEDSYIHDLYKGQWSPGNYNIAPGTTTKMYCGYDASHPEGNHSDGVQMHDGANVTIKGNTFFVNAVGTGALNTNAGLMMNSVSNALITGNHFRYGVYSINMTPGLGLPVVVSDNTFYGNNGPSATGGQNDSGGAIIRPSSAGYTFSNNLWEIGTPVKLINGA